MDGLQNRRIARDSWSATINPDELAAINRDGLEWATAVQGLTFAPNSQLPELALGVFCRFSSLKSVCIPATVEIMRRRCFTGRNFIQSPLETVTFEPGSRLRTIESKAFWCCPFMKSFFIPRSVENMTSGSLPASPLPPLPFAFVRFVRIAIRIEIDRHGRVRRLQRTGIDRDSIVSGNFGEHLLR
jgi:hypothetical protein